MFLVLFWLTLQALCHSIHEHCDLIWFGEFISLYRYSNITVVLFISMPNLVLFSS